MAPLLKASLYEIKHKWTILEVAQGHAALDSADQIKALYEEKLSRG